jgi:hypothetical protein
VRNSGQPEVVTLWTDPKEDRQFLRAVNQNRVLTVIQQPGAAKRDYGEIVFKNVLKSARACFLRQPPALGGGVQPLCEPDSSGAACWACRCT